MTAQHQPFEGLTPKEVEVMELYSSPFMDKSEICNLLCISMGTLNNHIVSVYSKLRVTDRFAASWWFWRLYPEYWVKIKESMQDVA